MSDVSLPARGAAMTAAHDAAKAGIGARVRARGAFEEFEALLLGVLLESALPQGAHTFGKGIAGNVARSQLAQQLAVAIAAGGTLGIAGQIGGR